MSVTIDPVTFLVIVCFLISLSLAVYCLRLKRRNRQLETFRHALLAQISHEFRTPLTILKGFAETLRNNPNLGPDSRDAFLKNIELHTERLVQMVDHLLEVSKMEISGPSRPTTLVRLPDFLERLRLRFQCELEGKQIEWVARLEPPLENVETDPRVLELILNNLIDNAIKYSPGGGIIRIEGKRRKSRLHFAVSDKGIGISEADQEKIFERFYRAHRGQEIPGSGLGLAIVRHAVQSLGGRVWVVSQPGKGASFNFTING